MKKPAKKPKADAPDKGMTAKQSKVDEAKDKRLKIKENSPKDLKMDSPAMLKLKTLFMGRGKKSKGGK